MEVLKPGMPEFSEGRARPSDTYFTTELEYGDFDRNANTIRLTLKIASIVRTGDDGSDKTLEDDLCNLKELPIRIIPEAAADRATIAPSTVLTCDVDSARITRDGLTLTFNMRWNDAIMKPHSLYFTLPRPNKDSWIIWREKAIAQKRTK